jgi:hypothetical protein
MTTVNTPSPLALVPSLKTAWHDVDSSFERFCLTAGIGAIEQMLCDDAQKLAGAPHNRGGGRIGHRWGRTKGKIGFHGGKVAVQRPRVRSYDGHEIALPTWTAAQAEGWLGRWAMNLMLINVSTRKLGRAVRLPEGDLPVAFATMVSNTGSSFPGEVEMTCNTSEVAVCRCSASPRSSVHWRSSLNSRAFSMAMTACAAKFVRRPICDRLHRVRPVLLPGSPPADDVRCVMSGTAARRRRVQQAKLPGRRQPR